MVNACISCSVCTGLKRGDRVYPRKAAGHRYYCTWTSSRPFVHWDCWIYVTRGDLQANRNLHGTKVKRVRTKRSRHSKTARIVNWFSHVIHHDTLSKTVLKGSVEGRRHRGRQWMNGPTTPCRVQRCPVCMAAAAFPQLIPTTGTSWPAPRLGRLASVTVAAGTWWRDE